MEIMNTLVDLLDLYLLCSSSFRTSWYCSLSKTIIITLYLD